MVIFLEMIKKSALKRDAVHSTAKILLVHHCVAISAITQLLLYMYLCVRVISVQIQRRVWSITGR